MVLNFRDQWGPESYALIGGAPEARVTFADCCDPAAHLSQDQVVDGTLVGETGGVMFNTSTIDFQKLHYSSHFLGHELL